MKIGILTHPQGTNYGGILQCYALCTYLKKLGHEPIVIQRVADKSFFLWSIVRNILKTLHFPRYYHPDEVDRMTNIRPFIQKYLVRTEPIDSQGKMKKVCRKYGLEAVIVGSDQVWRYDYAINFGYNYFLDFVPKDVVKLSYAASLGLNVWKYNTTQTEQIKRLLSTFRDVSVRENDAVQLCTENLKISPKWLMDPTLLLTEEDYNTIIRPQRIERKYLFVYWLGDKSLVSKDIDYYRQKGYKIIDINLRDNKELYSIEHWLSYIKYADYIITDSFHGCVFSIIFKKQFIVRMNKSGGTGRLISLFNMLRIPLSEDGFISPDYESLDLEKWREKSFNYLSSNLRC